MEWQPSEECTEGVKNPCSKSPARTWTVTAGPEPLCSNGGRKRDGGEGDDTKVLTLKAPSYPHIFLLKVCCRKSILH